MCTRETCRPSETASNVANTFHTIKTIAAKLSIFKFVCIKTKCKENLVDQVVQQHGLSFIHEPRLIVRLEKKE